jgi:3-oxoacyl-[acyl-carrier protein] reductase
VAEALTPSRVALVTGAGTGIGARAAVRLAEAGADVAIHYRSHQAEAERVADACRAIGRRSHTLAADFAADPGSAARVVEQVVASLGRIDILVNNAADVTAREPFETHSRVLFERVLAVNVTAAFLASQAAANHMIAQGDGGRIVNIGSIHGRTSAPGRTAYEVSKAAIAGLTFSTAVALGKHGITVNCVAPGAVVVERYALRSARLRRGLVPQPHAGRAHGRSRRHRRGNRLPRQPAGQLHHRRNALRRRRRDAADGARQMTPTNRSGRPSTVPATRLPGTR